MTSWFTSTLQSVREKSIDAFEFVRKDLSEFSTIVKTDTETYLHKIKSQPTDEFGINRIVSRLNVVGRSDKDAGKHFMSSTSYDRLHNEKLRLQKDESTYLIDPSPIDIYKTWCERNDLSVENRKGDITQLLIDAPHIRSLYAQLVPACTTHQDFWSRYYFRLHQFEEDETKRLNLLKRAHEICNEKHGNDWDAPDDDWVQETNATSNPVDQQTLPTISVIPERCESDTVSGDSWEREFDETDFDASKNNSTLTDKLPEINVDNNSLATKNTMKELDDDWEPWP